MRMKFTILGFLLLCFVLKIYQTEAALCNDTRPQPHDLEKTCLLKEKNKATLIEFMEEIWNKGNFKVLHKFISFPYTIFHDPGDAWEGQSLDPATFEKRVLSLRKILPDLHFTLKDVVAEVDKVAISWELQGTHKGDVVGLPPATGKQINLSGLTIYHFSNGKISGHWQIVDRLGFMEQLKPKVGE